MTPSPVFRRRMIRRYLDQPVARELIDDLLAAAVRAPSPHNRQPWRFALLMGDARFTLAQTMGTQLRHDLMTDGVASDLIEKDAQRSYQRITSAPVGILACLSMVDMDIYPDDRRNANERWMAGQAVAAACQNILLRATELGLGACWMCAPLFCQETVRTALMLPVDWEAQAFITIGYAADTGRARERKPIDAITLWRTTVVTPTT